MPVVIKVTIKEKDVAIEIVLKTEEFEKSNKTGEKSIPAIFTF